MRIGIDARMMGAENARGIGRYTEEMIKAMLPELRDGEELVLFERDPANSPIHDTHVKHVKADIPWYGFAEQIKFPIILYKAHLDILWVPHWNIPIFYPGKLAVTIHDLLLIVRKKSAKLSTRSPWLFYLKYLAFRLTLFFALHRARVIFPPTETVHRELMEFAPHAEAKYVVTGEGVTHMNSTDRRLINEPYLFYVGSAYPHKRLDLLLDVWSVIEKSHPNLHLVIGGEKDLFMKRYEERVSREPLPRVRFLGTVSDEDLSAWLTAAEGFVFSSEYEGFGLPPMEAILCGTPAVVSDIPILREVLPENGVLFFEKGRVDDMIRAIETLLNDREEWKRRASEGAAQIRARHTWKASASKVIEALRKAQSRHTFHDKEKETTRRASGMEEDEHSSRVGTAS